MKKRVWFHEFNIRMGKYCYLPIVSGILRAYCVTSQIIRDNFEFMPFIYVMEEPKKVWERYEGPPDIAAFSVSMWNEQLCLKMAKELKETYGNYVTIVFGGYQVPHHPEQYMLDHSFIDVCILGEGEDTFLEMMEHIAEDKQLCGVDGLVCREPVGSLLGGSGQRPFVKDLDQYPSPYLTGMFDELLEQRNDKTDFQAIIETNRGCSFPCSFCAWGRGGLTTRYRFHSMERVKTEISWCGYHKIPYLFNADANFAMHPRDYEIAEHLVETKRKFGYPQKFRTCFGKNTDEKIFKAATLLHSADMEKGITLARQSNDPTTLKNIRRDNISLETYRNLQSRFNEKDIPVYIELILGLPGETVGSWKKGIDDCLLNAGTKNCLFVYLAQVLPNTELASPEYQKKHGIRTKKVELAEIHGSKRDDSWIKEYEEIVISTNSMPYNQWREMCKFSWATMLLHSMKAGFFVMAWLWDRFKIPPSELIPYYTNPCWDKLLDDMTVFGQGRGEILPEYGDVYWDVEEAALLKLSEDWDGFYIRLASTVRQLMYNRGNLTIKPYEIDEVMVYQQRRMPQYSHGKWTGLTFEHNIPEYFDKLFGSDPVPLERKPQTMTLHPKHFENKEQFARETVLWGRKSGTMLVPCTYEDVK